MKLPIADLVVSGFDFMGWLVLVQGGYGLVPTCAVGLGDLTDNLHLDCPRCSLARGISTAFSRNVSQLIAMVACKR